MQKIARLPDTPPLFEESQRFSQWWLWLSIGLPALFITFELFMGIAAALPATDIIILGIFWLLP